MGVILVTVVVFTTVVLAITVDPQVKPCEYCNGPITLKEFLSHFNFKKCSKCSESS